MTAVGRMAPESYADRLARVALSGKRILITGGAGFIGTTLARGSSTGTRSSRSTTCTATRSAARELVEHPNFSFVQGDVLDADALREARSRRHAHRPLRRHRGRRHGAPEPRADDAREHDRHLQRARGGGSRRRTRSSGIVDFSTSEVFGTQAFRVAETSVTVTGSVGEARWTYAVSKLAGEHMAHAYHAELGLPTTTVRPFNVYGPGQIGGGAIRAFIEAALAGQDLTIHGDGSQIRAWTYVDDMVAGTLLALEHPNAVGESFNIGNARSAVTIFDLAQRIKRLTGCAGEIVFQPLHYTDVELRIPNVDKARELLGFEAASSSTRGSSARSRGTERSSGHSPSAARRRRGGARGDRRGARERAAHDGPEGARARGAARRGVRSRARCRRLVGDGGAAPRDARARRRAGRRGRRARVHVPGDGERRRALRRPRRARRRRPGHVQPRRRPRWRRALSPRTKAVLAVHLFGRPLDWDALRRGGARRRARSSRTPPARSARGGRAGRAGRSASWAASPSTRARSSPPARAAP